MSVVDYKLQLSYKRILKDFLENKSEQSLYEAQKVSKFLLEQKISPEEFVSIHFKVLTEMLPQLDEQVQDSFVLLLEVMMGYGLAYQEHQVLRNRQQELESEIDVAASMQQTLLPQEKPETEFLDVGVVCKPAKKMSGDYYHYVHEDDKGLGMAIADIIGKGVPAALCMSMIKYAMDSLPSEQQLQPSLLLENLNRVVAQNVGDSMFITMMYGYYNRTTGDFHYSGAGHEPGFFYSVANDAFEELHAKGLVLGVSRQTKYKEYTRHLDVGDFIVLLSDGVTECRIGDEFIEREEITKLIRKYMHLPAQETVNRVYEELVKIQDFVLRDDFTLILLRRTV
ncbi:PP2C family protein-serine/threonine phosphatase [Shouchella clausii]|uniref:Indirect positive regulator of sigma-B activity n=3 Tax=Shouchella TaxID=2893057 RepID=Q5WJV3_SHOC1|nr:MULTISPECIES: PP2C family protein-serine/threonine phosphatase [Shouchella]MCM3314192.1 PP2C family protein-serine/threonine phosphatase [Psychrobacillus sp. MER TA 17]ALA52017.1 Serine phosphatase RsbU, regulator of sigma subunit [Shouchella clausii]KKI84806.1 phosphoserine phosphatase [Shouchella clausii]MBU3230532.1 PP2C family protein-serine/threonine phosphatase [Shouchella clausii]MBU3262269.1 PP2C family protein-serine/threonine phosphatase [Shouchella clausii]